MFGSKRVFAGGAAIVAALVMVVILSGFASAGTDTVCVAGYVINHREIAVDGTKFTPPLRVEAVGANGQSVFADVNKDGYFKFEKLPVGSYNFRMQLPEGWDGLVPTTALGGLAETGVTKLEKSTNCYRIVFKIRRQFDLVVFKWEELLNFKVQAGADWEITAAPVGDPYVQPKTVKTDVGGQALFTLTPGKWTLTENVKGGWIPLTPSQVTITLDQYDPPGFIDPVIFKNREPACSAKIVVQKLGFGTDVKDVEQQLGPIAGWKISVRRADNTIPPMYKLTDGQGYATFADLRPGVYVITEQVQPGWKEMDDANPQTRIVRDCEETEPVIFRNKERAGDLRIFGYKWYKAWEKPLNGSPMVGLSSWVVTATLVGTDTFVTTMTNGLGYYEFSADTLKAAGMAFPGATIEVTEETRSNWLVCKGFGLSKRITFPYPAPASYTGARVDFCNFQDPPIDGAAAWVAPQTTTAAAGCSATYVVQRGDTLAKIAVSQGTTVAALTRASGITNPNLIRTGQAICVP